MTLREFLSENDIVTAAHDQRYGTWTRIELVEMDLHFCQAVQRAHPEFTEPQAQVEPQRCRRAG